jgi:hypothetical protein
MKLLKLGCKTLREGVVVSVIFFVGGLLLVLAAQHAMPATLHLDLIVLLAGFVLLLMAPAVLLSTFLLSILSDPRDTDQCQR